MKYRMEDGTVMDTARATACWEEATGWDGRNSFSRATGSQWRHQTLYRSRRGRYYVVTSTDGEGSRSTAAWVTRQQAAAWLALQDHDIPDDLADAADAVIE